MLTLMQNLHLSLLMLIYSSVSFLLFPNGVPGGLLKILPIKYSLVIYIFLHFVNSLYSVICVFR